MALIKLATVADEHWSRKLAREFAALVQCDVVGEHVLTQDAEAADLILFIDAHQNLSDWRMRRLRTHYLVRKFGHKVFVYDERDQPRDALPGIYVSMPRHDFDPGRQRAFSHFFLKNDTRNVLNDTPDLLFSFQGRCVEAVRQDLLRLEHPRALIEDTSRLDFFSDTGSLALERASLRYREVLGRSKFVLCPRGAGTSSFRLFEALACGRVPVILSDEWVAPQGIDWSSCSIRVPEAEAATVAKQLEGLDAYWPEMSAAAKRVYDEWFSPEVWFHRVVEQCRELQQGSGGNGLNARFWLNGAVWRDGARHGKSILVRLVK